MTDMWLGVTVAVEGAEGAAVQAGGGAADDGERGGGRG